MQDPLTTREFDEFIKDFVIRMKSNYHKALKSGALSEEEVGGRSDHTVARCVAILTASQMKPVSVTGLNTLKNLECSI